MPEEKKSSQPLPKIEWVEGHIQRTVKAIAPVQSEDVLLARLLERFNKHHRQRRRLRRSLGLGALIGVVGSSFADIEWLDLIDTLMAWFVKPVVLKMGQLIPGFIDRLS